MFDGKIILPPKGHESEGTALRAVVWSELTARLDAARDLRRELRHDRALGGPSFSDAAAGYFASLGEGKRSVNRKALEGGNRNGGINPSGERDAAEGEREFK